MPKTKKLDLDTLKVQSFITTLKEEERQTEALKGGSSFPPPGTSTATTVIYTLGCPPTD